MVDNDGEPVKRRQAYVTKNFEFQAGQLKAESLSEDPGR